MSPWQKRFLRIAGHGLLGQGEPERELALHDVLDPYVDLPQSGQTLMEHRWGFLGGHPMLAAASEACMWVSSLV